ncbi:MAG: HEPN domain-containing protein [Thermomicrobiales bacterium]
MRQVTRRRIEQAEGDLLMAQQSLASGNPVYDGICFHAQQCVEKYLKAVLEEQGTRYPYSHNLPDLAALTGGTVPDLYGFGDDLIWLTTHAVETRYSDASVTAEDAERAMQIALAARRVLRVALGLAAEVTS